MDDVKTVAWGNGLSRRFLLASDGDGAAESRLGFAVPAFSEPQQQIALGPSQLGLEPPFAGMRDHDECHRQQSLCFFGLAGTIHGQR